MAKVIGFDNSVKKQITCRSCAAIVEYVENEVQKNNYRDISQVACIYEWINCPNCAKAITVRST